MEFHWGITPESKNFFERHPQLDETFIRVMDLANRTFGREYKHKDRLEQIGFNLGQTCRVDFLEILFLAAHGWGIGASKLLRGLYERAVALAYMIKNSEKAERFFRYAAIQEYKVMIAAVELVGEEEFDKGMDGTTTVAKIKELREKYKSEFKRPVSWDEKGVLAQAQDVGEPYTTYYLGGYAMPNMNIHASLASAMQEYGEESDEVRKEQRRKQADYALFHAHAIILMVIRSQNDLFSLGLEGEIEACQSEFAKVWSLA